MRYRPAGHLSAILATTVLASLKLVNLLKLSYTLTESTIPPTTLLYYNISLVLILTKELNSLGYWSTTNPVL